MSVLVYAESPKGKFKKTSLEVVYYGHLAAKAMNTDCIALVLGSTSDAAVLGKYGASKVIHVTDDSLDNFDAQTHSTAITKVAENVGANLVVFGFTANGKALTGRVGVKMNASILSGVSSVPNLENGFVLRKSVFSGKANAHYNLKKENKVISLMGNSFQIEELGSSAEVETMTLDLPTAKTVVKELKTVEGTVPLPEAELVVSAGRGMKGPENWGIIEELARTLGATTACSRPVADTGWRPHHEHVGQTGVAIRPNLYIAAGISGAIQHLAGVNKSKVIVVINKDPEAPFFKAADYGICADLFDVVPRLNEALKKFKQNN